jgi:hypothetical protein
MQDTDNVLYNRVERIAKALDGNLSYIRLPVSLTVLRANNAAYADLITAAKEGCKEAIAARCKMRQIITGQLRQIANYLEVCRNGDLAVLLTSGLYPLPPGIPAKPRRRPTIAKITHSVTGKFAVKSSPVHGSRHYELIWAAIWNSEPGSWPTVTAGESQPATVTAGDPAGHYLLISGSGFRGPPDIGFEATAGVGNELCRQCSRS